MADITIQKMEKPRRDGDWHDAPLRWEVNGPGDELQQFSTRADARLWRKCRRVAPDYATASRAFALA